MFKDVNYSVHFNISLLQYLKAIYAHLNLKYALSTCLGMNLRIWNASQALSSSLKGAIRFSVRKGTKWWMILPPSKITEAGSRVIKWNNSHPISTSRSLPHTSLHFSIPDVENIPLCTNRSDYILLMSNLEETSSPVIIFDPGGWQKSCDLLSK